LAVAPRTVTRYDVRDLELRIDVAEAAERMKAMRDRRRAVGLRELRLVVPDSRSQPVRQRIAIQVARLDQRDEQDALAWIETIAEFDVPVVEGGDAAR